MNGQDKIYKLVTDKMIEALENGVVPWRKPWNAQIGPPCNYASKKPYRGVNVFVLGITALVNNYSGNNWMTFKQVKKNGGRVRKGEHGTQVVFWKWIEKKETVEDTHGEREDIKRFPMLRYYLVFNQDQIDGIDFPKVDRNPDEDVIHNAEKIWNDWTNRPSLTHGGGRAYYSPTDDEIVLPVFEAFDCAAEYHCTKFHEMIHATGHKDRLNRLDMMAYHGDHEYSKEELVAEMGAAFLCAMTGIEGTFDNSAAYIANWLKKLQDDRKLVVMASAQAQKAVDAILGVSFGE